MEAEPLQVVSVDVFSGHQFLVYFSDETYARISAEALAECFPEREVIPAEEED